MKNLFAIGDKVICVTDIYIRILQKGKNMKYTNQNLNSIS